MGDEQVRQATLKALREFIEELKREQHAQLLQLQTGGLTVTPTGNGDQGE